MGRIRTNPEINNPGRTDGQPSPRAYSTAGGRCPFRTGLCASRNEMEALAPRDLNPGPGGILPGKSAAKPCGLPPKKKVKRMNKHQRLQAILTTAIVLGTIGCQQTSQQRR